MFESELLLETKFDIAVTAKSIVACSDTCTLTKSAPSSASTGGNSVCPIITMIICPYVGVESVGTEVICAEKLYTNADPLVLDFLNCILPLTA